MLFNTHRVLWVTPSQSKVKDVHHPWMYPRFMKASSTALHSSSLQADRSTNFFICTFPLQLPHDVYDS
jgi:hypothetical protein